MFSAQVFTIGQLSHDFAHGLALELQAVSVVHEAVEDGVCKGIVTDAGVPLIGGQLADRGSRGASVAIGMSPEMIRVKWAPFRSVPTQPGQPDANVSQLPTSPCSMPRLNHSTRCREVPCVNVSGTT
jgi:hypothetical protein